MITYVEMIDHIVKDLKICDIDDLDKETLKTLLVAYARDCLNEHETTVDNINQYQIKEYYRRYSGDIDFMLANEYEYFYHKNVVTKKSGNEIFDRFIYNSESQS